MSRTRSHPFTLTLRQVVLAVVFSAPLLMLPMLGCSSYQTRTYDVSVRNQTDGPIVVWLTKTGEPYEKGWLSPEDIAIESPKMAEEHSLGWTTIDPGKRMGTGRVKGQFLPSTRAKLRVYANVEKFSDILATGPGSANRLDLDLRPGRNSFLITAPNGVLHAEPAGAADAGSTPASTTGSDSGSNSGSAAFPARERAPAASAPAR